MIKQPAKSDLDSKSYPATNMTLDITSFIDRKGGNAEEIRESQRKRGHSVELVDEIIQMYDDWVKSTSFYMIGCATL